MRFDRRFFAFRAPKLVVAAALSVAVACAGSDASAPCAERDGLARDQCVHDELLAVPASDPDQVIAKAGQIEDPMMRHAAVSGWVAAHVNEVPMAKGKELCALLEGRDRGYCERRLSSPHLKR